MTSVPSPFDCAGDDAPACVLRRKSGCSPVRHRKEIASPAPLQRQHIRLTIGVQLNGAAFRGYPKQLRSGMIKGRKRIVLIRPDQDLQNFRYVNLSINLFLNLCRQRNINERYLFFSPLNIARLLNADTTSNRHGNKHQKESLLHRSFHDVPLPLYLSASSCSRSFRRLSFFRYRRLAFLSHLEKRSPHDRPKRRYFSGNLSLSLYYLANMLI